MSSAKQTPFDANQVASYERKRYRGIDQRLVACREKKIIRQLLKKSFPDEKRERLCLDAPCGYGRFSRLLLEHGFCLISADLSPAMVERARNKALDSRFPIGIVVDMMTGLPFRSGSFDLIFCLRFFHHLHRPEERKAVLREFHRLTKGPVIISFYRQQLLHRWQRQLRRWLRPSPTRISMLPLRLFRQEAQEAGFRLKELKPLWRGLHGQQIALLEKVSEIKG